MSENESTKDERIKVKQITEKTLAGEDADPDEPAIVTTKNKKTFLLYPDGTVVGME